MINYLKAIKNYQFNPLSRRKFVGSFITKLYKSPIIIEVGVFEGDLSFSTLIKLNPKELHLIDPYKYYHANIDDTSLQELEDRFHRVLEKSLYYSNCFLHRCTFSECVQKKEFSYLKGKVDVVYVDGDHSFEGALNDLNCANSVLHRDGCIILDDYFSSKSYGIVKAVNAFLGSNPDFYVCKLLYNQLVLKRDFGEI